MKKRIVTNIVSRGFGKFATYRFHPLLQKFINYFYVKFLNLEMDEFKSPKEYESLNALFTRELLKKRVIDNNPNVIIAPTDSLVTECGKLHKDKALQIKGMEYSIEPLLGPLDSSKIIDGDYINFYLSPKDYHRYHMPYDLQIKRVVHIPGKLYPVNLRFLRKKINLFIENERVVLECYTKEKKQIFIVLVGALNVGQMVLVFEKRLQTNQSREITIFEYEDLWLKKGELLGYFKMGSTVLLFFEKDMVQLLIKPGKKVKFGEAVAKIV